MARADDKAPVGSGGRNVVGQEAIPTEETNTPGPGPSNETPAPKVASLTARQQALRAEASLLGDRMTLDRARRIIERRLLTGFASPWLYDAGPPWIAALARQGQALQHAAHAANVAGREARERER